MRISKKTLFAGIAAAVLTAIVAARSCGEESPEVETAEVIRGVIEETIPVGGKIRPVTEVEIAAEVSGEIVSLPVAEGDRVKRGDILLKIRQDSYLAALESAKASLGMLKAEYVQHLRKAEQAEAELERVRALHGRDAVADSRLESAEAEKQIADSQLEAAGYAVRRGEAALREASDNLARTVILSPMDGTVSLLAVKKGERIVGTSQMAGTLIMRIADLSKMELVVNVGENDVVKMHEGDSAEISMEAYGGQKFEGTVSKIANSAKFVDGSFGQVTNFEVRIAMAACPCARPGMSATAAVKSAVERDILKVPARSIYTKGHEERLWKVEDGRVHSVKIETGLQDLDFIGVLDGLKEGDVVVTAPGQAITDGLSEGMKVRSKIEK